MFTCLFGGWATGYPGRKLLRKCSGQFIEGFCERIVEVEVITFGYFEISSQSQAWNKFLELGLMDSYVLN